MIAAAGIARGQDVALNAVTMDGGVDVAVELRDVDRNFLIANLKEGHRTAVEYQVRIYREASGLRKLLGDRLIAEISTGYRARWDPFDRAYVIETDVGDHFSYRESEDFFGHLFNFRALTEIVPAQRTESRYCLARARIEFTIFPPPLTILAVLVREHRADTPWRRTELRP